MQTLSQPTVQPESMSVRVALHPFLAGMSPAQLAQLSNCAIRVHFKTGQTVLREGDLANRFYLVESGEVVLESGEKSDDPLIIETIGAGDLLGWSWMFPPYVWNFTARATKPTQAIFFYGTILREYCARDPSLGYELFKRMAPVMLRRLQAARQRCCQSSPGVKNWHQRSWIEGCAARPYSRRADQEFLSPCSTPRRKTSFKTSN